MRILDKVDDGDDNVNDGDALCVFALGAFSFVCCAYACLCVDDEKSFFYPTVHGTAKEIGKISSR